MRPTAQPTCPTYIGSRRQALDSASQVSACLDMVRIVAEVGGYRVQHAGEEIHVVRDLGDIQEHL